MILILGNPHELTCSLCDKKIGAYRGRVLLDYRKPQKRGVLICESQDCQDTATEIVFVGDTEESDLEKQ